MNELISVANNRPLTAIDKFTVVDLDKDGKAVFEEFRARFIELRKVKDLIPPEQFMLETNFYLASCESQTDGLKKTLKYFTQELAKDLKVICEINGITRWQRRHNAFKNFIQEQRRLKRPLPLKYAFWQRVGGILLSVVLVFFPVTVLSLLLRRRIEKKPPPAETATPPPVPVNPPIGDNSALADKPPSSNEPNTVCATPAKRSVAANMSLKDMNKEVTNDTSSTNCTDR
jgi:hypothetical protein